MPSSGPQKELTVVRKLIEAEGYKVVPSGRGHWKILDKHGTAVIDENGPLQLSGTSSEIRGRDMAVKRLLRAGVLRSDPWAKQKPKDSTNGGGPADEDPAETARREREAEQQRRSDQEHARRTHLIRERLEPVIARLGGWDKRGMLTEIGTVAHYFAERMELPERWSSARAASENADSLRKGATLSATMAGLWESLLNELEAWPDTQLRWLQLLAEAKGAQQPTIGAGDMTGGASGWTRSSGRGRTPAVTPSPAATNGEITGMPGDLALRAMFEMGVGRPAHDPDRRVVLGIGQEILRLELAARQHGDEREGDA